MPIVIYDPTATDSLSSVRGVGRFIQTLREQLPPDTIFTADLASVPRNAVFVQPFINLLQSPVVTKRLSKKQVGVVHDVIPLQFPDHFPTGLRGKWNIWRNRKALNAYDVIVTETETSKQQIVHHLRISPDRVRVITPRIHTVFNHLSKRPASKKPYVMYVGDVTWNKNLVTIARAVQRQKLPCVFVGNVFRSGTRQGPWAAEFNKFMSIAHNDERFIFPGFVSDEALVQYYRGAVANILVSREEGFGFSYFEAASQKTPSILSDTPIFHETADDTCIFVDPNSPDQLADAIIRLARDTEFRAALGQKAYERFRSFVDSPHQLNDLLTELSSAQ